MPLEVALLDFNREHELFLHQQLPRNARSTQSLKGRLIRDVVKRVSRQSASSGTGTGHSCSRDQFPAWLSDQSEVGDPQPLVILSVSVSENAGPLLRSLFRIGVREEKRSLGSVTGKEREGTALYKWHSTTLLLSDRLGVTGLQVP